MSKGGAKHPPGLPDLTADELALWTYAIREVRPKRGRRLAEAGRADAVIGRPRTAAPVPATQRTSASRPASHPASGPSLPAGFDRRKVRKIISGRVEIEARLDLHGLRQAEAHSALRRFLFAASKNGLRHVLVITGTGSRRTDTGEETGVLRRNVPRWISGAELSGLIVSYSTAHVRHGGEGALYIALRSPHKRTKT